MNTTLYFTKKNDPNMQAILIAAQYINLPLTTQEINKKYDPLTLLTPEGTFTQPNTILQYIAYSQLSGQTETDKLRVWQWFQHLNLELHPLLREIYQQISNERPQNKEKYQYALKELLRELDTINNHLKLRTFLVGDSATVVDISLATHLDTAFRTVLTQEARKKIPNLTRWFTFLRSAAPFKAIIGEANLCGKQGFVVSGGQEKQEQKEKTEGLEK